MGVLEVLDLVAKKLKGVDWVLLGSLSLFLQGVEIEPHDIDILTDEDGIKKISKILKEYERKPIEYGESEFFSSYMGEYEIKGIKIEVMFNLKEKIKGVWKSLQHRLKNKVFIKGYPVSPLHDQLRSYKESGRPKDAEKIEKIKKAIKESEAGEAK